MSILNVCLFGGISVSHEKCGGELKLTPLPAKLLAFLILQRHRAHSREVLIGYFWGEHQDDRARNCFNTAWWRLRRLLEPDATSHGQFLLSDPLGDVAFNKHSDFWLDVAEFEECIKPVLRLPLEQISTNQLGHAETALGLYAGDLMEGYYDDWALQERERLHQLRLDGLIRIMDFFAWLGDYPKSLEYGRQIIALDPLREDAHRKLMRLYAQIGQRSQALRQYFVCRDLVESAFGLPLMPETEQLYAALVQDTGLSTPASFPAPPAASQPEISGAAVGSLIEATRLLEEACRLMRAALQLPLS